MARYGLNTTLSYNRDGLRETYQVRTNAVTSGIEMLGAESRARMMRSFYPHRVTTQRFFITVQLKGYDEHKSLVNWLTRYVDYALDPDVSGAFRDMTCSIPTINFLQYGVPLTGIEWGDKVGRALWVTTIEFETTKEPWASKYIDPSNVDNYNDLYDREKASLYWYPEGVQLGGNNKPISYDKIIDDPSNNTSLTDRFNETETGGNNNENNDDGGKNYTPGPRR